ncbi:hypothetical protein ADIARSV_4219 [Arcticibacter svalbardensis MN12-7]|uniref:Uncharacterized protein n=1 Tax=Arcticibacter svalbardensis MN12-7 TaxID=1150600 RepID=R9GLL4_9SPHI|nr:hypothetical protein ADIARSV_4219 [Arcticibacter svalbardensis MN12-7]
MGGCTVEDNLCEAAKCEAPVATLKIKLVDKLTNKNLLDKGADFKLTDLSITSTAYHSNLVIKIDSTELNSNYISILSSGNEALSLKFKNYPEDVISINSRIVKSGCCSIMEIQSLTLNESEICSRCASVQIIEIRK